MTDNFFLKFLISIDLQNSLYKQETFTGIYLSNVSIIITLLQFL